MTDDEVKAKEVGEMAERITTNKVVSFHYRLAEVDSSGAREDWREFSHGGVPLTYLHGFHNVVVGVEKALEGKTVGDTINITLQPEEAYGERNNNAMQRVPIKHLKLPPGTKKISRGTLAAVETDKGMRNVVVMKAGKFNADVDFNHPLAGRILYYELEVMGVRDATAEEISHGHVHGPGGHQH